MFIDDGWTDSVRDGNPVGERNSVLWFWQAKFRVISRANLSTEWRSTRKQRRVSSHTAENAFLKNEALGNDLRRDLIRSNGDDSENQRPIKNGGIPGIVNRRPSGWDSPIGGVVVGGSTWCA